MPVHSIHVYSVAVKKGYVGPLNVHKIHYFLQRLVRDDIFNLLRSPEIDSASLGSLSGRYDNPIPT